MIETIINTSFDIVILAYPIGKLIQIILEK